MAFTVATAKQELEGLLHGTNLNQITDLNGVFNRAARQLVADVDPLETVRIADLINPLYDQVYDYACPSDLKGDRIIDIRPQVNRNTRDRMFQLYNEDFDLHKAVQFNRSAFTVQYNTSVKTIRIAKNLIAGQMVNPINAIQDPVFGTWSVGGSASNLRFDRFITVDPNGSLACDLAAGSNPQQGFYTNSTQEPINLTRDQGIGEEFIWVYLPISSAFISFELQWGSSPTDYFTQTVFTAFNDNAFIDGWNLLGFLWESATTVGSPDFTAITYLKFIMNYDGTAVPGVHLNDCISRLGTIYEIEYYSKDLFRDALTGAFKETVSTDNDIINLDTDSYNVFMDVLAMMAAQQQQSSTSASDVAYFDARYQKDVARYVAKIKSQITIPRSEYYSMQRRRINTIRRSSA